MAGYYTGSGERKKNGRVRDPAEKEFNTLN